MITPPPFSFLSQLVDEAKQVQQAGVDLTLKKVFSFKTPGKVDFSNEERKLAEVEELAFDEEDWLFLPQGSYKVVFNEHFHLPKDVAGFALTRTTLLRSGVSLHFGLWDPGFEGMAEALMVVHNSQGFYVKRNARVAQIIFIKLEREAERGYDGAYKGLKH